MLSWIFVTVPCADIYTYVNEDGVTLFTNIPRDTSFRKVLTDSRRVDRATSFRYSDIISSKSSKYNIDSSLIEAIISVESNWKPSAVSQKGAVGLMQLMPSTISDMRVRDPYDPEENIEGGTRYFRLLLDRFNGDLELALAAYNAGPGRVEQYGGIPPISETRKYVRQVLALHDGSGSVISLKIHKIILDDGTVLYTNIPGQRQKFNSERF